MAGRHEPEVVEGPFNAIAAHVETNRDAHDADRARASGARMLNAYSLVNSQAVYEGQRAAAPNQRVLHPDPERIRGAAAVRRGDVVGRHHVHVDGDAQADPGGPGLLVSGMPYWTMDSGGFAVPPRFASTPTAAADLDEWRELNTRWFEYATFLPILRVHGQSPPREIWEFGGEESPAYAAMLKFDRLRYRLLPYIYSLAGAVTQQAGTILRPLVMDFPDDEAARDIGDQYMFGPAFLVSPVTTYRARSRSV